MSRGASAPGKLMVVGEYAVLDGHRAVVAAVSSRVEARWVTTSMQSLRPEVVATLRLAEAELGTLDGALNIDASSFQRGGSKFGLGSSSAAAAAAAGAVFARQGLDPALHRDPIFRLALAGHKTVAPDGSGADVAAAVHGGFLGCQPEDGELGIQPLAWPASVEIDVVWTGASARTSDLVAQVRKLCREQPSHYHACLTEIAKAADRLVDAMLASSGSDILAAVADHHRAMAQLGECARVPVVEARLADIARLAEFHGGAAKPSGAGGGDVALAFFVDRDAAVSFRAQCEKQGYPILDIQLGAPGVLWNSE